MHNAMFGDPERPHEPGFLEILRHTQTVANQNHEAILEHIRTHRVAEASRKRLYYKILAGAVTAGIIPLLVLLAKHFIG